MGINVEKYDFKINTAYLHKNRLKKKSHTNTYNQFSNKPLNNTINFRGLLNPKFIQKGANLIFPPKVSQIPQKLEEKAVEILTAKSNNLADLYLGFKNDFIQRITTNEGFRLRLGINDKTLTQIKSGQIISIPEQNLLRRFFSNIFAPFKVFRDLYSFILTSKLGRKMAKNSEFINSLAKKNEERLNEENIIRNYKSYTGLIDSIKIWEAKQRKTAGLSAWDGTKDLITSNDILESKVMRRWLKSVDPTKGKYQTKHQMLGNRLISGLIYGIFLGNDAYNLTMRYSNNKDEAKAQRRSRFAQELAKIGINMYLINLFIGTFEKYVNKNLFHALFTACATTMTAEILGRKLVGRPIFPSDKQTLDEMNKKMEEKKGFWVSIGRIISGTKPKKNSSQIINPHKKLIILSEKREILNTKANKNTKTNFNGRKQISFGSLYTTTNYMDAKTVKQLLDLLKTADIKIYEAYVKIINKYLKQNGNTKDLQTLIETGEIIPIGTKKTIQGNLIKSIASPYFFIKKTVHNISAGIKKLFSKNGTGNTFEEMKAQLAKLKEKNPEIENEYRQFLNRMLSSQLWKSSSFDKNAKEGKILEEFLEAVKKDTEEIEGVKNILLFLDKHLKSKDLNKENVEKIKDLLFKNFMKTDGSAHVEYDGNTFAMMNINLSRLITTLFLVVDAYNLSIQYSNNDKHVAVNNSKSRALQEASRITVSAYMLAFVHNLLSKFCNSSLMGAFTTTALTSSVNDTIARKVVGVPIGTKTQKELIEIDKQNAKSKSPLKRTLAYLVGKKQKNNHISKPLQTDEEFSLYITNSFKSMLDGE